MLRTLRIRNLAVIEAVEVELDPGFTALTGETGAGKSILVEAVGLLLGGRASSDLVRTGTETATIEAVFDAPAGDVLIRRDITAQGRSRSYVNGALATAAMLREVSADLVELHGQHEHQSLLDPATHLSFLDADTGLGAEADRVAFLWSELRGLREQLAGASMDTRERSARLELVSFQLGEIDAVRPEAGEDEALEASRRVLANAERVDGLCRGAYSELVSDDEGAALAQLGHVWKKVEELAALDPAFAPYLDARAGLKAQLEDLAVFLRAYADGVDASPARLHEVEERLVRIERVKRKYGPSVEDVVLRGASLRAEAARLRGSHGEVGELEHAVALAADAYLVAARGLSVRRRAAAAPFADSLKRLLANLAMGETRFEVRFVSHEADPDRWGAQGIDGVEFYVSPNPGEDPRPLARIASGGELSRIMLALRTHGARRLAAAASGLTRTTLIFDEVDAGIGGRAAEAVGRLLQELGERFQVLCITHLAPIAARATTQCAVEKRVTRGRTVTVVARLSEDERVTELSRMLTGSKASDATRASARELLHGGAGAKVKQTAKGESESRRPRT